MVESMKETGSYWQRQMSRHLSVGPGIETYFTFSRSERFMFMNSPLLNDIQILVSKIICNEKNMHMGWMHVELHDYMYFYASCLKGLLGASSKIRLSICPFVCLSVCLTVIPSHLHVHIKCNV